MRLVRPVVLTALSGLLAASSVTAQESRRLSRDVPDAVVRREMEIRTFTLRPDASSALLGPVVFHVKRSWSADREAQTTIHVEGSGAAPVDVADVGLGQVRSITMADGRRVDLRVVGDALEVSSGASLLQLPMAGGQLVLDADLEDVGAGDASYDLDKGLMAAGALPTAVADEVARRLLDALDPATGAWDDARIAALTLTDEARQERIEPYLGVPGAGWTLDYSAVPALHEQPADVRAAVAEMIGKVVGVAPKLETLAPRR